MKKILNVLLGVVLILVVFKIVTSTFFIWMVASIAAPQLVTYAFTNCRRPKKWLRSFYANRYVYSLLITVAIPLLSLKFGLVIAAALGVGISYLLFENIKPE